MKNKTILHIDMDSYFASVEQQANPFLRGKPIAVSGHPDMRTVVAAASVEAKKYGVKSAMSIQEARRLCPKLYFVLGDPEKYVYLTKRIINIFLSYTDLVEVVSIDEAFMDVTAIEKRHGGVKKIAQEIKRRLKKEIGDWMCCSIGIAPNKLIAKLASGLKKPDGLVLVKSKDISSLLKKIELTDLWGIGPRLKQRLALIGINTISDLQNYPLQSLIKEFGEAGFRLHQMSLGKDSSLVSTYYEEEQEKSMGHQYTLPKNTLDKAYLVNVLLKLSERVARRLRRAGLAGRVVNVTIRYADFETLSKQKTGNFYLNDGFPIYKSAKKILNQFSFKKPVRLIGVSVSQLTNHIQQTLPFLHLSKQQNILKAIDEVNNQYGEFTLQRASLLFAKKLSKDISGYGLKKKF